MEFITFVIAVAALLIAGIAFQRTGGIEELKRQVEASKFKTDGMRDRTADVLDRLERVVRGKKKGVAAGKSKSSSNDRTGSSSSDRTGSGSNDRTGSGSNDRKGALS